MFKNIVVGSLLFISLTGCGLLEPEVKYANGGCPKVMVVGVKLEVNKQGGLDKLNRIKAFQSIRYYTNENNRVNRLIDAMNAEKE